MHEQATGLVIPFMLIIILFLNMHCSTRHLSFSVTLIRNPVYPVLDLFSFLVQLFRMASSRITVQGEANLIRNRGTMGAIFNHDENVSQG